MKKPRPIIKSELARFKLLCKAIDKARNRLEKLTTNIKTKIDKRKFESPKEINELIIKLKQCQDLLEEIEDLHAETAFMKNKYGFKERDYLKS